MSYIGGRVMRNTLRAGISVVAAGGLLLTAVQPATAAPPTAPQSPAVTAASMGDFTVEWTVPSSDGGQPIIDYTVTAASTEPTAAGGTCVAVAPDTSCTVEDLDNGIPYTFSVVARNADGNSPAAITASATAIGYPMAPRQVVATPDDSQAHVTWQAPVSNGGGTVLGYQVTTLPASAGCTTTGALQCTIPGLDNGTTYAVSVVATNQYGPSHPATAVADVTPRTVPGAPTGVIALHTDGGANVTWTAPADNGGATIDGYFVSTSPSSAGCAATAPNTSCSLIGLTNGVTYSVTVRAENVAGWSSPSSAVSVVPSGLPGSPTHVQAQPGNESAQISWTAPDSDGGDPITAYNVQTAPASAGCSTNGDLNCTIPDLDNGTTYTVTVIATNDNGSSAPSAATTVTPYTVPGPPTLDSVTPGNGTAMANWTAPADSGGSAITGYIVSTIPASPGCTTDSATLSCELPGLVNGTTYSVTVVATNVGGSGAPSNPIDVTPRTVPNAPISVTLTPGDQQLTVDWGTPTSNGGSPITGYTATAEPGGANCTVAGDQNQCAITGLTNGQEYVVVVVATNAAGTSEDSGPAISTPRTVPGMPQNLTAVPGNSAAELTWDPPASDGGAPVTSYVVSGSPSGACTTNGATSCVIDGLTNGVEYDFSVTAVNVAGSGLPSPDVTVTPVTVPSPPVNVTATGGSNNVLVSWSPPVDQGGSPVTSYTVSGAPSGTCQTASNECLIPGLADGQLYTFTVVATNGVGDGLASAAASARTWTVPSVPRNLVLKRPSKNSKGKGIGAIRATWLPPTSNGGSTITAYRVTANGKSCTTTNTSCVIRGLKKRKVHVTVAAVNGMGTSKAVSENSRIRTVFLKSKFVSPNRVQFFGKGIKSGQTVRLVQDRNRHLQTVREVTTGKKRKWRTTVTIPWSTTNWRAASLGFKTASVRTR